MDAIVVAAVLFGTMALALVSAGDDPCEDCPVMAACEACPEAEAERGNPRSRWLGKEVLVRQYGSGEEERCVVICESWKGAVRVRRLDDGRAYWVRKDHTGERVREA